mmetsp:Transcript_28522/g.32975  ORF Transcript_28522/g.32975 Transcript_28522/m.32975 type:complete len:106 (+) Transcript_28522:35-352(+)
MSAAAPPSATITAGENDALPAAIKETIVGFVSRSAERAYDAISPFVKDDELEFAATFLLFVGLQEVAPTSHTVKWILGCALVARAAWSASGRSIASLGQGRKDTL